MFIHTHTFIYIYRSYTHTRIYIYACIVHTYISLYIYIYIYIYICTLYYTKCAQGRDTFFVHFLMCLTQIFTLAHRNEEWDSLESLHEVFEVSPSELSVSTQASALCLRPDRRVSGLSTTLDVSVSVKASPTFTNTSWSDSKWSKHEWSESESINTSSACSAVYLFILIYDMIYIFCLLCADHLWISHPEDPEVL